MILKQNFKPFVLSSFAFVSLMLVACSGIRVVRRTPTGGEVALLGMADEAREKANTYMRQQCPMGYDIEEHEAIVGQDTAVRTDSVTAPGRTFWGAPAARTSAMQTTSTTDKREWRIVYQCRGVGAPLPNAYPQPNNYPAAPPTPIPALPPAATIAPTAPLPPNVIAPSVRPSAQLDLKYPNAHVLYVSWVSSNSLHR